MWTTSSLKLDLHDVTVKLEPEHGVSSFACINFIKSRLVVETYSDLSQDIDLVSQVRSTYHYFSTTKGGHTYGRA